MPKQSRLSFATRHNRHVTIIAAVIFLALNAGCAVRPTIFPDANSLNQIRVQSANEIEAYHTAFNQYGIESGWMFDRIANSSGLGRSDRTARYIESTGLHQMAAEAKFGLLDYLAIGAIYVGTGLVVAAFGDGNGGLAPFGVAAMVFGGSVFSYRDTAKRRKAANAYNKWLREQVQFQQGD